MEPSDKLKYTQHFPSASSAHEENSFTNSALNHVSLQQQETLLFLDPTPIGPRGVRVVDEFNLAESPMQPDKSLLLLLRPLLKRKRCTSDEASPRQSKRAAQPYHEENVTKKETPPIDEPESYRDDDAALPSNRFRNYQSEQWTERFQDLLEFKEKYGHCDVPYTWQENQPLAQWVKRQRYQYRLKKMAKHSTMTDKRFKQLKDVGFCWDYHGAVWEKRLSELREFKAIHGHCNVPGNYHENRQLAIWVKRQRRQHKLFCSGDKTSNMNVARMTKLESLGFMWDPRSQKA